MNATPEPSEVYRRLAVARLKGVRVDGDVISTEEAKAACGQFSAKMADEMQRIDQVLALTERMEMRTRDLWNGAMSAFSIDEIDRLIAVRDNQLQRHGRAVAMPTYLTRLQDRREVDSIDILAADIKTECLGSGASARIDKNFAEARVPDLPMVDGVYRNLHKQQLAELKEDMTGILRDLGLASDIFAEAGSFGIATVSLPAATKDSPLESLLRLVSAAAEMRNAPQFRKAKLGAPVEGLGPAR
ncbi:hypothetical protein [Telmatospirillum siberiense]|nr:hypothetical protein [Telmatospirillum siberiense]